VAENSVLLVYDAASARSRTQTFRRNVLSIFSTVEIPSSMFEFPCIISLYYIKHQRDATSAVLFISHCKITLHVSDDFCAHHQEY